MLLASATSAVADKPNIILFYLDDLDAQSMTDAHLRRYTPTINARLREEGLTFSKYVVTTPLCSPSRATLLTGLYSHNHGVFANAQGDTDPDGITYLGGYIAFSRRGHDNRSVGVLMQRAGYFTAFIGKYMSHFPLPGNPTPVVPGWNEQRFSISSPYYGFERLINGARMMTRPYPDDYKTDVERDDSVAIVRNHFAAGGAGSSGQPLFLVVAPLAPHLYSGSPDPIYSPIYADLYASEPLPQSRFPNYDEPDISDKASFMAALPPLRPGIKRYLRDAWRDRLRAMRSVDDMVGAVIQELQAAGRLDNTYIFLTSDNGFLFGEHRVQAKQAPYEGAYALRLFVRGPGVPPGRRADHLVSNIDLLPTFAAIAGQHPGLDVDGRSLLAVMKTPSISQSEWRSALLVEHRVDKGPTNLPMKFDLLRTRTEAYIQWYNGEKEYYDLVADPYQLQNIYSTLSAQKQTDLVSDLSRVATCAPRTANTCRPAIAIEEPVRNQTYMLGTILPVRWSTQSLNQEKLTVTILGPDGRPVLVRSPVANTGSFDLLLDGPGFIGGDGYRLRISEQRDSTISAISGPFSLR